MPGNIVMRYFFFKKKQCIGSLAVAFNRSKVITSNLMLLKKKKTKHNNIFNALPIFVCKNHELSTYTYSTIIHHHSNPSSFTSKLVMNVDRQTICLPSTSFSLPSTEQHCPSEADFGAMRNHAPTFCHLFEAQDHVEQLCDAAHRGFWTE